MGCPQSKAKENDDSEPLAPAKEPVLPTRTSATPAGLTVNEILAKEAEELRTENARLKGHLHKIEESMGPPSVTRGRTGSMLEDGTFVNVSTDEMVIMKEVFDLFDENKNGSIDHKELMALHKKLGEPITPEEAKDAMALLDPEGTGEFGFPAFVKWWHQDARGETYGGASGKAERYKAKFKFLKARLKNPDIGKISWEGVGDFPSLEYRIQYYYNSSPTEKTSISPWHDITLKNSDGSFNMVVEIPKWTRKKMEIATGEGLNPIKQDTKNGKLREYKWGDMMWNYGALPQTWEDPKAITENLNTSGDNDPIDAVEIGIKQWPMGSVIAVKVLGVLAMIDSGETDWKLVCISTEDPLASKLEDIGDVEAHMPGAITAIHDWLRDYKSPDINEFGYNGECKPRAFAEETIMETHEHWKKLIEEQGKQAVV